MNSLTTPPEIAIPDFNLKTRVELIIYNLKLREALFSVRKKWKLPAEGLELDNNAKNDISIAKFNSYIEADKYYEQQEWPLWSLLDDYINEQAHASYWHWLEEIKSTKRLGEDIDNLISIVGLTPQWRKFMRWLIIFNNADIWLPKAPWLLFEGIPLAPFGDGKTEITLLGVNQKYIQIKVYKQIKNSEWSKLYENQISPLLQTLPSIHSWNSAGIKQHWEIAEMARNGIAAIEIAGKLGHGISAGSVRKMLERARQQGL